jgi:hypothetical protein
MIDREQYLEVSDKEADGGKKVGANPLAISKPLLFALDCPTSPISAIRAFCVECSGGNATEARKCTAVMCPLWAFRMGTNPFHAKAKVKSG